MSEEKEAIRNPIITPADPERWPLLEVESQACSLPMSREDEECVVLMDSLLDILDEDAAGLAAIQVGYPRRIFLLRNGVDEDGNVFNNAYVNPTIVSRSTETKLDGEACLSLPHMSARIPRPKKVVLKYYDVTGQRHEETFTGFWARAVMHEMDHLNGILLSQHLEKQISKQTPRSSFGMKLTPHRKNVIARRRATNKRARKARKATRASGR